MGFIRRLTGDEAANAAEAAGVLQSQAIDRGIGQIGTSAEQAQGFVEPFAGAGLGAVDQAGFLTDPQAQFEFLQNNPLFKFALQNLNTKTGNLAASKGRLSAGDTLEQLTNNTFLAAAPLIAGQKASILDLLNLGTGVAGTQANIATNQGLNIANLLTDQGAIQGAAQVGAANAQAEGLGNIIETVGTIGGLIPGLNPF